MGQIHGFAASDMSCKNTAGDNAATTHCPCHFCAIIISGTAAAGSAGVGAWGARRGGEGGLLVSGADASEVNVHTRAGLLDALATALQLYKCCVF